MANQSYSIDKSLSFRPTTVPTNPREDEIYLDAIQMKLLQYRGGTWKEFGAGLGGSKNYLSSYTASLGAGATNPGNGDFESGLIGWSLAKTALSGTTPTSAASPGTPFDAVNGGSAADGTLSLSVASSGQIAGLHSGALISSGPSVAGDMLISDAFFIDEADQAKNLGVNLFYKVVSGVLNLSGSSSNTHALWFYDVSNGVWIQPQGVYDFIQGKGVGLASGSAQTSPTGTQYQIALININATAGAYTLYVDDCAVGPEVGKSRKGVAGASRVSLSGPIALNPSVLAIVPFDTVTFDATGSLNVTTTYDFEAPVTGFFSVAASVEFETNGTGQRSLSLFKNGVEYASLSNEANPSAANTTRISGSTGVHCIAGDRLSIYAFQSSGVPFFLAQNGSLYTHATYELIASETSALEGAVIAASYTVAVSGANSLTSGPLQKIQFDAKQFDTTDSYDLGNFRFVAPVSGIYDVSGGLNLGGTTTDSSLNLALYKNGILYKQNFSTNNPGLAYNPLVYWNFSVPLNAGDYIEIFAASSLTDTIVGDDVYPGSTYLQVHKIGGSSSSNAADVGVYARYNSSAGQLIPTATYTPIVFENKDRDTTNSMNPLTGDFTCPVAGDYEITVMVTSANGTSFPAGTQYLLQLVKNGSGVQYLDIAHADATIAASWCNNGSTSTTCKAGDVLGVYFYQDRGSDITVSTDPNAVWIEIKKL